MLHLAAGQGEKQSCSHHLTLIPWAQFRYWPLGPGGSSLQQEAVQRASGLWLIKTCKCPLCAGACKKVSLVRPLFCAIADLSSCLDHTCQTIISSRAVLLTLVVMHQHTGFGHALPDPEHAPEWQHITRKAIRMEHPLLWSPDKSTDENEEGAWSECPRSRSFKAHHLCPSDFVWRQRC